MKQIDSGKLSFQQCMSIVITQPVSVVTLNISRSPISEVGKISVHSIIWWFLKPVLTDYLTKLNNQVNRVKYYGLNVIICRIYLKINQLGREVCKNKIKLSMNW